MISIHFKAGITQGEWQAYLNRVDFVPLSQCWAWGNASQDIYKYKPKFAVIKNGAHEIGCFMILEKTFFKGIFKFQKSIQGPLFFKKVSPSILKQVFIVLREVFPRKLLSTFSCMVNFHEGSDQLKAIDKSIFIKAKVKSYESQYIDLSQDQGFLEKSLKTNWRRNLKKAEKQDFVIELCTSKKQVLAFFDDYDQHRKTKKFRAPAGLFYQSLYAEGGDDAEIWQASKQGCSDILARIFILQHGKTVTYVAGVQSEEGRRLCANHLLFWRIVLKYKERGARYFDLGGIHMPRSKGVDHFKAQMGGTTYKLAGTYV